MPSTIAPTKMIDAYAATMLKGPTMVMGSLPWLNAGGHCFAVGTCNAEASKTFPAQKVSLAVAPVDDGASTPQTWLKNFE